MDTKLYFAYGSNMNADQMKDRCPQASPIGLGILKKHRFIINTRGVATVIPNNKNDVCGVLWRITPEDEQSLDYYEGVRSNLYRKANVKIYLQNGDEMEAMIYIATNSNRGQPRDGYLEKIIACAERFSFPNNYIAELREWLETDDQHS